MKISHVHTISPYTTELPGDVRHKLSDRIVRANVIDKARELVKVEQTSEVEYTGTLHVFTDAQHDAIIQELKKVAAGNSVMEIYKLLHL